MAASQSTITLHLSYPPYNFKRKIYPKAKRTSSHTFLWFSSFIKSTMHARIKQKIITFEIYKQLIINYLIILL